MQTRLTPRPSFTTYLETRPVVSDFIVILSRSFILLTKAVFVADHHCDTPRKENRVTDKFMVQLHVHTFN